VYGPASQTIYITETVPFSLSATAVTIATPGASSGNASTVTIKPLSGFTGSIYLSCALATDPSGAENLPTCSISPSVNVTGNSDVTAQMTVSTTAATTGVLARPNGLRWIVPGGGAVLALIGLIWIPAARRRWLVGLVVLAAAFGLMSGCGSHGSSTGPTPPSNPGTTPGTYVFTVTGSFTATEGASQTQTANVTVTVQ
jgi:hypothetical protein